MMRFRVFAVGCAVLLSGVAIGQIQVDLGIKGGLNYSGINTSSSAVTNYNNIAGYHAGVYGMVKFGSVALQPEIVFSRQGQQYTYPAQGALNLKSHFDYVNVPIIFKVYLAGGLNLQIGPQFGFLTNSSGYTILNSSTVTAQSLGSFVKSSDVSLGLGAAWDLPLGLNVTARYNVGLSDINKNTGIIQNPSSSFGNQQAKNLVFQVSVGYRLFKIGS